MVMNMMISGEMETLISLTSNHFPLSKENSLTSYNFPPSMVKGLPPKENTDSSLKKPKISA